MQKQDSAEWILRTVRRILKDVGPNAARRFVAARGGPAKWQTAAQEIARHTLREQATSTKGTFHLSPFISGSSHVVIDLFGAQPKEKLCATL